MTKTFHGYLAEQKVWEEIPLDEINIAIGPPEHRRSGVFRPRDVASIVDPHSARYRPRDGLTFCNIYVSDFTRVWDCEIPHWLDGRELTADVTGKLIQAGKIKGWKTCSATSAVVRAIDGFPIVAFSPGAPGHIAIMGDIFPDYETYVYQAGAKCGWLRLKDAFGSQFPYVKYAHYDRDQMP